MAGKFFVRFNLHNSICSYPISFDILKPLVDISEEELKDWLKEIDHIQNNRAMRLKTSYSQQIEKLNGKKVLFLGDSITSDNLGYRETVIRAAGLKGINGSISGGTSSMILHSAKMLIESEKPDIVSLMIGTNDSISTEREDLNMVSIAEYERNVREIVRWAKRCRTNVLLFEIPPIIEATFSESFAHQSKIQTNKNIQKYNKVLKFIAEDNKIELLSNRWLMENREFYEPDGIHLSLNGQEMFAKKWLNAAIS